MTQGPRHPLALALPALLLAGVLFTALDTTGKLLLQEHSLFVVVWARYVGQMLIVTAYARHRTGPHFWRTRHPRTQLARSALLVVTSGAFYVGLRYLPLAEATAIMFATPLLVVLLSGPVLGERATRGRVVAALAGFVGVLLLLRPGSAALHPAVVVVLGAALCNAFYQMLTTKVAGDGTNTSLFYSTVVGAVVLTLALPWGFAATTLSPARLGAPRRGRFVRGGRPRAHDPRVPARAPVAAGAVHLRADAVGGRVRLRGVRAVARPVVGARHGDHRRQRRASRAARAPARAARPQLPLRRARCAARAGLR